jgi:hypothetical protein
LDGGQLSAQYQRRVTSLATLNRALRIVLWCALVAGIAIMSLGVRQVDLWWQLPEGLSILHTHHLPTQPPAAFGLPAQPYIDEYGLYEVGLGALYFLGGLTAIHVAFIATYLLIFLAPLTTARGIRRDIISLALLALAGIFMVNRYEQRPEIAGVLLFSLLLVLMRRSSGFGWRFLLRLGALMTLWTNVHSSYLIGLLALFLWLSDRVFLCDPRLRWRATHAAATLAVVSACVLINPYGWHRIAFTFGQEHDLGSNLLSREMWPAWDQPPLVQALMIVTAGLLVLAILTRQRPPLWLLILAGTAYVLTLFNIRQMSFLAVTLLFLYAERREENPSPRWQPARSLVLVAGCIALLLFDSIALRSAWGQLTAGEDQVQSAFAPRVARQIPPGSIVLCHDAEGSFLSFSGRGGVHPLIDSGQGRFDDNTKRFYFFAVQTTEGFDLALDELPAVDHVFVTPQVEGWTLALEWHPGWHLMASDAQGLLFARDKNAASPHASPLSPSEISRLADFRNQAVRQGNLPWAFCLSTLIDDPSSSLELLDRAPSSAWSEPFFVFTTNWLHSISQDQLTTFVQRHGPGQNPLLRELLHLRAPTNSQLPDIGSSSLEKLGRVLILVHDVKYDKAQTILESLPRPIVSPFYYALCDQFVDHPPALTPAERWQDWNDSAEEMQHVAPTLEIVRTSLSPVRRPDRDFFPTRAS